MKFELNPLPYGKNALEPHISARTVETHYEKHHRGYMQKLEKALQGKSEFKLELEEIIRRATGAVFNNAAQVWNHDFYWQSLSPDGGGKPTGKIAELILRDFGSHESFVRQLAEAATTHFGSGWAWVLLGPNDRLQVDTMHDAENPLKGDRRPLLTVDVWEHAYYLDYQNARAKYVDAVIGHLLHWDFANRMLESVYSTTTSGRSQG